MAVFAAMVAVLLAMPGPATAHDAACWELWNPHGQTTPPAGYTTLPGAFGGQNEDGFYQVGACRFAETLTCEAAEPPVFALPCTCRNEPTEEEAVFLTDGCADSNGGTGWIYDYDLSTPCNQTTGVGCDPFPFGTVVKFIEANGKDPGQELMAGSKQEGSPAGDSSDSVLWQLWGQGDLLVTSSLDLTATFCCHVPEPPK
jgi:hypothetical protein